jgi:DNA-binding CsgD family transcriptional regulator
MNRRRDAVEINETTRTQSSRQISPAVNVTDGPRPHAAQAATAEPGLTAGYHRLAAQLNSGRFGQLPSGDAMPANGAALRRLVDMSFPDLDELAVQVYRRMLLRPTTVADVAQDCGVSQREVASAFDRLRTLRLLRPGPTRGCYVAVSPSHAEMQVITPLEQVIQDEHRVLTELRSRMQSLKEVFEEVQQSQPCLSGVFRCDVEESSLWLSKAAAQTESEVLMLQPADSAEEQALPDDLPTRLGILERGCRIRLIGQHTARTQSAGRAGLNDLTAQGVEVRTTTELVERFVVFDRRIAFVRLGSDILLTDGDVVGTQPGAVVVTDASMVALLAQVFEQTWRSAVQYDPAGADGEEPLDEVRVAILKLLASGAKDEVIARRLGMSPRTCRRHISGLMDQLNASSRFQAGLAAARKGLLTDYGDRPTAV